MAQVTDRPLLLIAGHGERGGAGDNARLAAITASVRGVLGGWDVRHGVLSGAPSIEDAVSGAGGRPVVVWPFFMCRGYFIEAVSRRLQALGVAHELLRELGAAPEFVSTARRMLATATDGTARLVLVVAHGSGKGPQSRLATQRFASDLARCVPFSAVSCAFLEEPPFAADAIAALPTGAGVVSLFAGDGLHGGRDMAALIADSGRDDLNVVCPAADIDSVARIAAGTVAEHGVAGTLEYEKGGSRAAREVPPPMPPRATSRRRPIDREPLRIRR